MTTQLNINFSHNYPKLHGQTFARLVAIEIQERSNMPGKFVEYDTVYENESGEVKGYYPLPHGRYIVLLFWGQASIPFTTVRRWTPKKAMYYQENVGKLFQIIIKETT